MVPKFNEWLKLKEAGAVGGGGSTMGMGPGIVGRNVPPTLQGSPQGAMPNGKPYPLQNVGDVKMKKSKK